MKASRQLFTLTVLVLLAAASFAQHALPPQLLQAQSLSARGQSRAAIAILEPLVQSDSHVLDDANLGVAWNLLGSAYTDFENFDKARRCFENAIHILREIPDEQMQYATALDNLGSVESSTDQYDQAKLLHAKARHVYEALGNHAGVAISSGNLTMLNIAQHDLRAARTNLNEALREIQRTNQLTDNNLATLYSAKGSFALAEGDFHEAIPAFQLAIDLWTHSYGPRFFMLGVVYALRAQVFEYMGDHPNAIADYRQALSLLEETPGRNAPAYLTVQIAYAQALRHAGSKQEAARLEKEARSTLANVRVQQCSGCTISAESFR
jgi:tetratricopeptide (TPR) repeat protein